MKKIFFLATLLSLTSLISGQSFTGSFDLIMTQQYKNGNTRQDTITYHFDTNRTAMVIRGKRNDPDMRMIFDQSDSTITNLFVMNDGKSGYILPMDEAHWPGMPQATRPLSNDNANVMEYTGREKTIEGFECREVSAENSDYHASLWVSEDLLLSMTHVLSYQSVGKGKSKKEIELFDQMGITGLPLEMQLINKSDGADVLVEIRNINPQLDEKVFSTAGHDLISVDH